MGKQEIRFTPEVELTHDQRAHLAHTLSTPGFSVINAIMRAEVDKFIVELINVDEDDEKSVVAKHRLSKAAAQFYSRVVGRLNSEAQQFMQDAGTPAAPTDPTAGLIDLGEFATGEEQPDVLAGFELNEQLVEEELSSE